MERNEDREQSVPGPHEKTDEETQEDAGMPGGGAATAPSDDDDSDKDGA
jgi:hypothetical protein